MSIVRARLSQQESRSAALEAARRLLIEQGPQAVTLKAVAGAIGKTHANLLHHFGSAAGLQAELARSIADSVTQSIGRSVELRPSRTKSTRARSSTRPSTRSARRAPARLAAWMILTGNRDALDPILVSIRTLVDQLTRRSRAARRPETTLHLVLAALGDSLLGAPITEALGLKRDAARTLAADSLRRRLEAHHPPS